MNGPLPTAAPLGCIMNRNQLISLMAAIAVLALLAFALYSLFEIEPRTRQVPPSREARVNEYLALDRWLQASGIPARVESSGDIYMISMSAERQIFIQASLFSWSDEAVEYLVRWVEEGGALFLALDYSRDFSQDWHDEAPMLLLGEFGIAVETGAALSAYHYESRSPSYDRRLSFIVEDEQALALKDWSGLARLVQVKRGGGTLTVSGRPRFLISLNLGRAPNARLAWALFATANAAANNEGWLFIRGTARVQGLIGSLFRQGNFPVLIVSVLVLLAVGLWTAIPVFGLVKGDDEKPGKALRERFLAEGRFLKRYGALDSYRAAYAREIKQRLAAREALSGSEEIENRVLDIWSIDNLGIGPESLSDRDLLVRALRGEAFKDREFPRMISIFTNILERI